MDGFLLYPRDRLIPYNIDNAIYGERLQNRQDRSQYSTSVPVSSSRKVFFLAFEVQAEFFTRYQGSMHYYISHFIEGSEVYSKAVLVVTRGSSNLNAFILASAVVDSAGG